MKKISSILKILTAKRNLSAFIVLFLLPAFSKAQSPQMFNYQGVARAANGTSFADKAIVIRLSLHEGTINGAVPYSETRNIQTNSFGLFSIQFGGPAANATTGFFSAIAWGNGNPKFLQVEMDANDNNGFVNMGTNQLISVPYALFAGSSSPTGIAGGDLSGSYPNPNVVKIQNRDVFNSSPFDYQALKWSNGNNRWEPMNDSLFLPYKATYSDPDKLFSITNTNLQPGGTTIYGRRGANGSGLSPAFSIGVWGDNSNGTGVLGTSNSSTGVYGYASQYHGIYGFSSGTGFAGLFGTNSSNNSYGVWGELTSSSGGAAIYGRTTGAGGIAGLFETNNSSSPDPSIKINHNGTGMGLHINYQNINGVNHGIFVSNMGKGSSLFLFQQNSLANVPVIDINNSSIGTGIFARATSGKAGIFQNSDLNTTNEALSVTTAGKGSIAIFSKNNTSGSVSDVQLPAVLIDNTSKGAALKIVSLHSPSVSHGIDLTYDGNGWGENINSTKLGLHAITTATGGSSILAENYTDGNALKALSNSQSIFKGAVTGINSATLNGVGVYGEATSTFNGIGVKGVATSFDLFADTSAGVVGVNKAYGSGVYGISQQGTGVYGIAYGEFHGGVVGNNKGDGNGLEGFGGLLGYGIFAAAPHATGHSARFDTQLDNNPDDDVMITNAGLGAALNINSSNDANNVTMVRVTKSGTGDFMVMENAVGTNKIRFSDAGKGFFNGGTQTGGADMAEAFDVTGNIRDYEPGDVMIISIDKDRAVEKSNAAYSTLVAGVYATKPGMLMTEENIDTDISEKCPMGVVGVIPTKVCLEGGEIHRGDMLVTSSQPGVAMKADLSLVKPGQVIGKALENYSSEEIGKIRVLVSIK